MSSIQEITEKEPIRLPAFTVQDITEPEEYWENAALSQLCLRRTLESTLTIEDHFEGTVNDLLAGSMASIEALHIDNVLGGSNSVDVFISFPTDWPVRIDQAAPPEAVLNTLLWVEGSQRGDESKSFHQTLIRDEALNFSAKNRLYGYLQTALRLLTESFSKIQFLSVEHETDPDSEDSWLRISMQLEASEGIQTHYNQYTKKYVHIVPWPERGMIRLNIDLAK